MKINKRQLLKTALGSSVVLNRWVTPTILSVALPAHAQTSACEDQTWIFTYVFNAVDCGDPSYCDGFTDQEIIASANKPVDGESICLTPNEISSNTFNRDIDFDNSGPVADYISIAYTINTKSTSQMSGVVSCSDVDTFVTVSGTWAAELA